MAYADGNIIIGTSVDVGGMNTGLAKIQRSMKRWGKVLAVGATAGLYKIGKAAIDAASDLQEIQNVVDVAFKDMSYKIEEFSKQCIEYFGMSEISAKQTAGSFMAMGASIGLTQEAASDMAVELTGLTGDFASFYNISQQYAKVALSAVYSGETETLKRYGIILTEANLQEYALAQGITKKVKAMNAAEKTLLRYNYIMETTQNMHHDFERTQESWANTLRVLQERWTALLTVVGSGGIRLFQPLIATLSTVVSKLTAIFQYLYALMGISSELDTEEYVSDIEDVGDAIEEVGDTIKHKLASFDKLNNIIDKGKSGDDETLSDLEKLYEQMKLSGYVIDSMKDWKQEIVELTDTVKFKLSQLIVAFNKWKRKFKKIWDDISFKQFFGAGLDLGNITADLQTWLSDSIESINWSEIGEKFGKLFSGIIWTDALGGWVDVLVSAFNSLIDMAISFVDEISIADLVKLAKNYSAMASKILKAITRALKKVKWYEVGKKIGSFLASINWKSIVKDVVVAMWEAIKGVFESYGGLLNAMPIATTIATLIAAALAVADFTGVKRAITKSLTKAITDWRKSALKGGKLDMTSPAGKAFTGAMGVITVGLGISLMISKFEAIKAGEREIGELKTTVQELVSSALVAAGIGIAAKALGFALGPAGIAGVFAVTLLANIGIDYKLTQDSKQERENEWKRQLKEQLETLDWYNAIQDTIDVLVKLHINAETEIVDITGEFNYYEDLAKKWYDLSQNVDDLSDSEKVMMKLYSDELVTMFPDLAGRIDEVSGAYKGTWEQLDLLIQKTQEYIQMEAYNDILLDYSKQLAHAQKDRYDAEKKLLELEERKKQIFDPKFILGKKYAGSAATEIARQMWNNSAMKNVFGKMDFNQAALYVQQNVTEAINKGLTEVNVGGVVWDLTKLKIEWDDQLEGETAWGIVEAIEDYSLQIDNLDNSIRVCNEDMAHFNNVKMELANSAVNKEQKLAFIELGEAISGTFSLTSEKWGTDVQKAFDELTTKLENDEPLVSDDIKKIFLAINNGFNGLYEGNLPTDLQTTLDTIREKIANGQVTLTEAMQLLAQAISSGFTEELTASMEKQFDLNQKKMERVGAKAAKFYLDGMDSTLEDPMVLDGFSGKGETIGKSISDGVVKGVEEKKAPLKESGNHAVGYVMEGMEDTGEIHSPSKATARIGGYLVEGMVNGIYDDIDMLSSAASDMVSAITDNVDKVNVSPTMTIVPEIDFARSDMPDIVSGLVVPAQVTANSVSNISGMTKRELGSLLKDTLSEIFANSDNFNVNLTIEGDPDKIFTVVQREAKAYNKRTGSYAFGG